MSVKSLALDLCGFDDDGCVLSLAAALVVTGLVNVAGALASDWSPTVEYVGSTGWMFSLDIW